MAKSNRGIVCIDCGGIVSNIYMGTLRCSQCHFDLKRRLKEERESLMACIDCGGKTADHRVSRCRSCYVATLRGDPRQFKDDNAFGKSKEWLSKPIRSNKCT